MKPIVFVNFNFNVSKTEFQSSGIPPGGHFKHHWRYTYHCLRNIELIDKWAVHYYLDSLSIAVNHRAAVSEEVSRPKISRNASRTM